MIRHDKTIALWLFTCAAAVFLMAMLGAVTRLTESGLSIVEWKPVAGVMMPSGEEEWTKAFGLYQTSPQYKKVNAGMSLEDFKKIYFWEWLHRLWGRGIGLIYALPLVWFWARGRVPDEDKAKLLGILGLGFLQGAMGWFMVKSGLVDAPAVSHYRLAAHLGLAFVIFCCMIRMGLKFSVLTGRAEGDMLKLRRLIHATLGLTALAMIWGAFVAGLRAGHIYNNDFPFMGANLWPGEIFHYTPWWTNFFENHATVQFTHRVLALLAFCMAMFASVKGLSLEAPGGVRRALIALWVAACVQVGLGITTLLTHVDIVVATLHQAGAMALLAVLMILLHLLPRKDS